MLVEPAATAVTVNVVLDDPAGTVADDGTVATAELLLVSETAAAVEAAAARLTVPWTEPPVPIVEGFKETAETDGAGGDTVGLEPPHWTIHSAASMPVTATERRIARRLLVTATSVRLLSGQ
jgi:hypothetical protein